MAILIDGVDFASKGLSGLSRVDFPPGFTFGVSTSAYQIEGAADKRGVCTWDTFSHVPGNIYDGTTGDVACDHYNRYEDDIQRLVDLGVDAYRFSISWPRIFPDGMEKLNQEGVLFYDKLINNLLKNGIEPYVTLFHWDIPQALEDNPNIKGFRTKEIVKYFAKFARTCFKLFGDRVKNWITYNEIQLYSLFAYGYGVHAPGRGNLTSGMRGQFNIGESGTEPYVVGHNSLLSHARAVRIYKEEYQVEQRGRIGIAVNCQWYEPYTSTKDDIDAAQRCIEFELGWVLDPILRGEYPESMRCIIGDRLPSFTTEELYELKNSIDFIGINYYSSFYAHHDNLGHHSNGKWYETDRMATLTATNSNGNSIGERMDPSEFAWLRKCPWGLPKILDWMETRYGKETFKNVPIFITENGTMDPESDLPMAKAIQDLKRVEYLHDILKYLAEAIKIHNYNLQGYFVWTLMDDFEWSLGFSSRFGIYHVDFEDGLNRHPKWSALWYKEFLKSYFKMGQH